MRYVLEAKFQTDDFTEDEGERLESIRKSVEYIIEMYSETVDPIVKIREVD